MRRAPLWVFAVGLVVLQLARGTLLREWVWLGVGGAFFLAVGWLAAREPGPARADDLGALILVGYLLHQFEEHGVDCLGRPYAFLGQANGWLGPLLGCTSADCPLTEEAIFFVNTVLVWWPLGLGALLGRRAPALTAVVAGLPAANAVAHLGPALLGHGYNPGLVTGLALFVPSVAVTWRALLRAGVPAWVLPVGLAWGGLGHGVLLGASVAIYARHLAPPWSYGLLMAAWGSLPLLALRIGRPR